MQKSTREEGITDFSINYGVEEASLCNTLQSTIISIELLLVIYFIIPSNYSLFPILLTRLQ